VPGKGFDEDSDLEPNNVAKAFARVKFLVEQAWKRKREEVIETLRDEFGARPFSTKQYNALRLGLASSDIPRLLEEGVLQSSGYSSYVLTSVGQGSTMRFNGYHLEKLHEEEPDEDGRHPEHKHLIFVEAEPHFGGYLLKSPAAGEKTAWVSEEDYLHIFTDRFTRENEFGYVTDEYLQIFEEPEK
jgi:hypothetical protein